MNCNDIKSFFLDINTSMIFSKDYIKPVVNQVDNLIVNISNIDFKDLDIAPLGYGTTKMSFLYNSYVDKDSLNEFLRNCKTNKKNSIVFDFKGQQGCLKSLVLTRDKTSGVFNKAKVFWRTVDLSKKLIPDLMLIAFILEQCDMFEFEELTLFIAHGFIMPAVIANTYDVLLGLELGDFDKHNPFHKKVLAYIETSHKYKPTDKRVMGGYLKLLQYKYKELSGEDIKPVTYKECEVKLRRLHYGK